MCRKLFWGIGFPLFAVLLGLSLRSAAVAETPNEGAVKDPATTTILGPIKQAHKLLADGNDDYTGHRAKADQGGHAGMKDMGCHHKNKDQTGSSSNGGTSTAKMKGTGCHHKKHHKKPQTGSSGSGGATTAKKPGHSDQPAVHEDQKS